MAQRVNLLVEVHKQAQAAYELASGLLPSNTKDKSTKIQRKIFAARDTARQVLNLAREADVKAVKAWRDVLNLENSDADFLVLQKATRRAEEASQQAKDALSLCPSRIEALRVQCNKEINILAKRRDSAPSINISDEAISCSNNDMEGDVMEEVEKSVAPYSSVENLPLMGDTSVNDNPVDEDDPIIISETNNPPLDFNPNLLSDLAREKAQREKKYDALLAQGDEIALVINYFSAIPRQRRTSGTTLDSLSLDNFCEVLPDCWLGDIIIDSYLEFLCLKSTEYQLLKSADMVWHSTAIQNFLSSTDPARSNPTTKAELGLNAGKRVLIPVNVGGDHWILSVADLKTGVVEIYDSIEGNGADKTMTLIQLRTLLRWCSSFQGAWSIIEKRCSQQNNGNDCGVWVLANATALIQGSKVMPANVDNHRRVIAMNILAAVEGKDMNLELVLSKSSASPSGRGEKPSLRVLPRPGPALSLTSEPHSKSPIEMWGVQYDPTARSTNSSQREFLVDLGSNPLRLTLTTPVDSLKFADIFPGYKCDSTRFGRNVRWLWNFLDNFEPLKSSMDQYVNATPIYPAPQYTDCRVISKANSRKQRPNATSCPDPDCNRRHNDPIGYCMFIRAVEIMTPPRRDVVSLIQMFLWQDSRDRSMEASHVCRQQKELTCLVHFDFGEKRENDRRNAHINGNEVCDCAGRGLRPCPKNGDFEPVHGEDGTTIVDWRVPSWMRYTTKFFHLEPLGMLIQ